MKGASMLSDTTENTVASNVSNRYKASFLFGNFMYLKIRKIFLIMRML